MVLVTRFHPGERLNCRRYSSVTHSYAEHMGVTYGGVWYSVQIVLHLVIVDVRLST